MRLFAAIDLPAAERRRLAAALADAGLPNRLVRVPPEEQWHLTVAFYDDVPEQVVPELTERLERAAGRTSGLSLALSGAGTFPAHSRQARVLWAGVTGDLELLSRLADRCVAAGRRAGLALGNAKYRPHVTVGRTRGGPADLTEAAAALADLRGEVWRATAVELIRSTLGAEVRHEVIASFLLA
jgi:2'-5' RNA ligase